MTGLTKLARKRDPNVPIGQPSALHVDCPCGRQVVLTTDRNPCDCGEAYNLGGWILDPQPIADFARELARKAAAAPVAELPFALTPQYARTSSSQPDLFAPAPNHTPTRNPCDCGAGKPDSARYGLDHIPWCHSLKGR